MKMHMLSHRRGPQGCRRSVPGGGSSAPGDDEQPGCPYHLAELRLVLCTTYCREGCAV